MSTERMSGETSTGNRRRSEERIGQPESQDEVREITDSEVLNEVQGECSIQVMYVIEAG